MLAVFSLQLSKLILTPHYEKVRIVFNLLLPVPTQMIMAGSSGNGAPWISF